VTLRQFRKEFGDRAEPLNIIWQHFLDHGQWIARRELHEACVRSRMEHLGGSIVRDARDGARECYRLTFLGVLLTADGPAIELLLVRYLEWLKGRRRTQANLASVSRDDVTAGLSITPAETAALWRVLDVAEWRAGPALEAVLVAPDLAAHVESKALDAYDPEIPIDEPS
jgi:hypothetical protein